MRRFSDAAREITTSMAGRADEPHGGAVQAARPWGACHCNGCPMPGALAHSTLGGGPWYCAAHFGRDGAESDAITARLRNRIAIVDAIHAIAALDPNRADHGARIDRIERSLTAANRADLCAQVRTLDHSYRDRHAPEVTVPQFVERDERLYPRLWLQRVSTSLLRDVTAASQPGLPT